MLRTKTISLGLYFALMTLTISEKCGMEGGRKFRISGGSHTRPNQYPWMVTFSYFQVGRQYLCGGSLISDRLVLTAKHCTKDIDHWGKARVGVHNRSKVSTDGKEVQFEKVFAHNTVDGVNDIAIILLKNPVDLSDPRIGTICLPQTEHENYVGENVRSMGWGMVNKNKMSQTLKDVNLKVDRKQEKYWLYTSVNQIRGVHQDPCSGDSGGPLIHKKYGQWTIIGTVNGRGYNCKDKKVNGLGKWNKVTGHLKWIKDIMKHYHSDTSYESTQTGDLGSNLLYRQHQGYTNRGNYYRNGNIGINKQNFDINRHVGNNQIYGHERIEYVNENVNNIQRNVYVGNNQISVPHYANNIFKNKGVFRSPLLVSRNSLLESRRPLLVSRSPLLNLQKYAISSRSPLYTSRYVGNNQINRHVNNNYGTSHVDINKANIIMGKPHTSGYINKANIIMGKPHTSGYINKENIIMGKPHKSGYINKANIIMGNPHTSGYINKANIIMGKPHTRGYFRSYPVNQYMSNNYGTENINNNKQKQEMDFFRVNGYLGNNYINRYKSNNYGIGNVVLHPRTTMHHPRIAMFMPRIQVLQPRISVLQPRLPVIHHRIPVHHQRIPLSNSYMFKYLENNQINGNEVKNEDNGG